MGKLTFGQTGLSYQCDKVELKVDGAPKCPRCQQRVYFNEEKKAAGKTWHSKCFTCGNCKKSLDTSNYNQHNGDQIYCTNCYRKLCGPQVYGFVAGAVLPTTADLDSKTNTVVSLKPKNSSSDDIKRSHSSSDVLEKQVGNYIDCCGRCGEKVYFAEEVRVGKKKWHKQCLRCSYCSKSIEPGKCSEHDGDLFCQLCYTRFFGPRGYGYGSLFSPELEQQDCLFFDSTKSSPAVGSTASSIKYNSLLPAANTRSGYNNISSSNNINNSNNISNSSNWYSNVDVMSHKSTGSDDGYGSYSKTRYTNINYNNTSNNKSINSSSNYNNIDNTRNYSNTNDFKYSSNGLNSGNYKNNNNSSNNSAHSSNNNIFYPDYNTENNNNRSNVDMLFGNTTVTNNTNSSNNTSFDGYSNCKYLSDYYKRYNQ
ncbi:hypothetical protein HELRODRAFT_190662 [Helobdella robusta]|uniref:LIM zinc-binding domain-containing protein n=1 Tax=Helobdella robusta TaxID=6412 RepID=T1FS68_HELRO|nr:hypothetical protein HELRODRAFT_190662 [Helobdella robusta]ESO08924.1 hypothetical protein HELRODRAFT_190662 [Helobdella robusta]